MSKEAIFGLIRHILTVVGGGLVAKGAIDESMSEEIIGIVIAIIGVAWSLKDKKDKGETKEIKE